VAEDGSGRVFENGLDATLVVGACCCFCNAALNARKSVAGPVGNSNGGMAASSDAPTVGDAASRGVDAHDTPSSPSWSSSSSPLSPSSWLCWLASMTSPSHVDMLRAGATTGGGIHAISGAAAELLDGEAAAAGKDGISNDKLSIPPPPPPPNPRLRCAWFVPDPDAEVEPCDDDCEHKFKRKGSKPPSLPEPLDLVSPIPSS